MDPCSLFVDDSAAKLKELPADLVDLTVTSPPYDGLRFYNGYAFDFETIARELYRVTKDGGVVVWVVADQTTSGSESGSSFRQALFFKECGFNLHDTMIWSKVPVPFDPKCRRYWQSFEYMFVLSKGRPKTCNYLTEPCKMAGQAKPGNYGQKKLDGTERIDREQADRKIKDTKVRSNVWFFGPPGRNLGHPAPFPAKLAEDHILTW